MKKVLIISPHFPPVNAPDHQRVRSALPYFEKNGWKPTVVAVEPQYVEAPVDLHLEQSLPDQIKIVRVSAFSYQVTRKLGFGNLSFRCRKKIDRKVCSLLENEKFDLIFFSTTQFGVIPLGKKWKTQFGVPYVVDIQDPWVNFHYQKTGQTPPGGKLKYTMAQFFSQKEEGSTLSQAAHVICVSPGYVKELKERYPQIEDKQISELSFSVSEKDFKFIESKKIEQSVFDKEDDNIHWVYIGRGGGDMHFAFNAFFKALKRFCDQNEYLAERLKCHFIGTSYAPEGRGKKSVIPLAQKWGVEKMVEERTDRIPYFQVLKCLKEANALLIFGSDDPSYTASKIYPYLFSGTPFLTVFHEQSSVCQKMRDCGAGDRLIAFGDKSAVDETADKIFETWFAQNKFEEQMNLQKEKLISFSAEVMTQKLCAVFDQAI